MLNGLQDSGHPTDLNDNDEEDDDDDVDDEPIREKIGPGGCRAVACAASGKWLAGSGMTFGQRYELLEELVISNGRLRSTGAASLAALMEDEDCTLKVLKLYACQIDPEGCGYLGRALRFGKNRSLHTLHLDGDETVGDLGAKELARGLETNRSLCSLSLSGCAIKAAGAAAIGVALESSRCTIQFISLEANSIGLQGLAKLCGSMARNRSLQSVNIASIGMIQQESDEASRALIQLIRENRSITSIDFNLNPISVKGAHALRRALTEAKQDGSQMRNFAVTTDMTSSDFQSLNSREGAMASWATGWKRNASPRSASGRGSSTHSVP